MKKSFYITTPIYYPSAKLHIGHAYSTTMADCITRYKKMCGYDTFFLTGSDEHGMKIQRSAEKNGQTPKEYVDGIVATFQQLWKRLDIENDSFIRTTDKKHFKSVQDIFTLIYKKGDIYKSSYSGHYCTSCETYFTELQLHENYTCPDCGKPTEIIEEESYFFKMSNYQDKLLEYINTHPDFIQPKSRRNEMINFIKQGLEDLSISRTSFDWGIPVPIDDKHVIYVWFDALTNYISALNWSENDKTLFEKFWPADIHLVGKDIARFHCIIWPCMLLSAGLPLPKQIFSHGWLLIDGGKMSKSKGNVVDPNILIDRYGSDALRYYLLSDIVLGQDGNYSEEELIKCINVDLANDYGNLVSRTIAMIDKYLDGKIVKTDKSFNQFDKDLKQVALETADIVGEYLECLDFAKAIEGIKKLISRANKYIDETTPWIIAKNLEKKPELECILYSLAEVIRISTTLFMPFMPKLSQRVSEQLGYCFKNATWDLAKTWGIIPNQTSISKKDPLFPRIDKDNFIQLTEKPSLEEFSNSSIKTSSIKLIKSDINFEDFEKLDIRVALVKKCELVEKADKLLKFTLDIGVEERIVLSGIREFYSDPNYFIGKKVILLANLKPRKIRGITSEGMILSVANSNDSVLETLLVSNDQISPGDSIS